MKIAVVHEWLSEWAGSEQVLADILAVLPEADLYSVVDFLSDADRHKIGGRRPKTTFVQRLPWARKWLERYLPLMPIAIEQFDLSGYDLIVSSSHAVSKGVITGPDQLHLSYVHSPMRYAWDLQHQYLTVGGLGRGLRGIIARLIFHYLRIWDVRTANGVDRFACNSAFIARRIRRCYRREADVIHPGIDIDRFPYRVEKDDFYLLASRLMPYKRVDLVVDAFRHLPERKLVVIGSGADLDKLRSEAPDNVSFLGYVADEMLHDYLARARAFIFAAQEDFGILPIEAQACGTPVIAFGRGGACETVRGLEQTGSTGVFFAAQTQEALVQAIRRFEAESARLTPEFCRENAKRFSKERFRSEFRAWVDESVRAWRPQASQQPPA
jgi:glycosyltransferase involved in cell wall biosynthesis